MITLNDVFAYVIYSNVVCDLLKSSNPEKHIYIYIYSNDPIDKRVRILLYTIL